MRMTDEERRRREASNRAIAYFFAGLLIVAGTLIAAASGLCIMAFSGPGGMSQVAWALGGLPLIAGLGMVVGGIAMIASERRAPPPRSPAATFSDDPPQPSETPDE